MKIKTISQTSLVVTMAKHIRKCAKELKEHNKTSTVFNFNWLDDKTQVRFNDKCFFLRGKLSLDKLNELASLALHESGCDGTIKFYGDKCTIVLFGKPVKQFMMLQRLIKKYANFDLSNRSVETTYYDKNGFELDNETTYLCYNKDECQRGIDFIRKHRNSKRVLKVESGLDVETDYLCTSVCINLIVETAHGKMISELSLFS